MPWPVKSTCFTTLTLSGLFFGAKKLAEHASEGAHSDVGLIVAGAAIAAEVVGDYLIHQANSQREAQHDEKERQTLAARNHHLRRGMAAALHRALTQAAAKPPTALYDALMSNCEALVQQAETDDKSLDQLFPIEFAEPQWEATNTYSPNPDEDARALAELLQNWLQLNKHLRQIWTDGQVLTLARQVLPLYQQAFADDLAADSSGLLYQAFTIKGVNQIRALVQKAITENREGHAKTQDMVQVLLDRRPIDLGKVRSWALPLQTDYFVGREEFLAKLHRALQKNRKVLVSAGGGYGKTQAALEYVRRFGGHYEDVLWVRASDGSSLFESYRQFGTGLGRLPQSNPTEADVQRAMKSWLAENPDVLLVFDNLDDPKLAKDYWPTADPQSFVLATSQKRDVSEVEHMHLLQLDVWDPPEALEFLMKRTERATLDDAERTAATKLVAETAYLPLALEQAGAYISRTQVSFAEYLRTYLRVRVNLLKKQNPIAGDYGRSVATTWKTSMERVSPAARELLAAISHLAPNANPFELITCAPDALGPVLQAALTDETEPDPLAALLGSLQEYSLVRMDRDARTFSLHKLLQEVVREDQPETERTEWIGRWVAAFGQFLPQRPEHQESLPHSRGWAAFKALFLQVPEEHPAIIDAASLADWYVYHFAQRGRWRDAEPLAVREMQVFGRVEGPEHPDTLHSVNNLAFLYKRQGRYKDAEPLYQRALAASERVLGPEHPSTLQFVNNLAVLYQCQGRYREAEPLFQHTVATTERVLGPEHPDTLESVNNLAALYETQGQYADAEPLYKRALAASERVLGLDHPHTLALVNNLAGLFARQGQYTDAEPLYQRELAALDRVLGPEHPNTLTAVNDLAILYRRQGRYTDAEPLCQRTLATFERALGPEHPHTLISVNNLAGLYERQGRFTDAEPLYKRTITAFERELGAEHPYTLTSVNNLAVLYTRQGRYADAEPLIQKALDARERVLGPEHPDTLHSVNHRAFLYESQGRCNDAEPLYQKAVSGMERVLGSEHPDTNIVRESLQRLRSRKARESGS